MRLDGKVSASVDVISEVPQGSVLGRCCLYCTPSRSSTEGNHIVDYADDTTTYAVIPRTLSPQVMKSLNPDLAAINPWCLKWYIRLNPKKTDSM